MKIRLLWIAYVIVLVCGNPAACHSGDSAIIGIFQNRGIPESGTKNTHGIEFSTAHVSAPTAWISCARLGLGTTALDIDGHIGQDLLIADTCATFPIALLQDGGRRRFEGEIPNRCFALPLNASAYCASLREAADSDEFVPETSSAATGLIQSRPGIYLKAMRLCFCSASTPKPLIRANSFASRSPPPSAFFA
jgi:hypothetical protein